MFGIGGGELFFILLVVLMLFGSDKIPDIAPLVDRNIAVYKDSKHSFTRNFDPKEIDEDIMEG